MLNGAALVGVVIAKRQAEMHCTVAGPVGYQGGGAGRRGTPAIGLSST